MDSARWAYIQELFHKTADLPRSEREPFLQAACGVDKKLFAEVRALIEGDERDSSLLDRQIGSVAKDVMKQSPSGTLEGQTLGRYRILKLLGEGGMGTVYLASRDDLKSRVAIKVLRDAWLSPARRERFASEQRTLAQLNHPAIARLYDADALPDGTPWFVMEFVEGLPLTEYCEKSRCSIKRRLELFRAVCEAVQYAHAHAVIHRDLKPSNILVKEDGSIRLLDFGIAKHLEDLDQPDRDTMTALRLMTPAYAAPEQFRGERVGIHTDVYALGVILYQLLSGRLPFDLKGQSAFEAAKIISRHQPARPSAVAKRVEEIETVSYTESASPSAWADLDVLCLTAMHEDPFRRYSSVEALIRDVDHFLHAEPLEARPDSLHYRLDKFVRRHRAGVAGTAAAFVVTIGLVVFFTVRLALARNEALAEAARAQRIQRFTMNLFQGGDETAGPAEDLRVSSLIDRGVMEAQSLSSEPATQAELYLTLGRIYQRLGNLEEADKLLNSALSLRQPRFGEDSAEVGECYTAMGLLRADQARFDEAEEFTRKGLEMSQRHRSSSHPAIAEATSALGQVLENRGKYEEAAKVLQQAMKLHSRKGEATPELSAAISELANTNFYAGHYDVSSSLNREALEMDRKLYGNKHPQVANDLINLGAIEQELGHYPEAEKFHREALAIIETFYGKEHPETASAYTMVARALVPQSKNTEAAQMLERALAINEKVYGKVHPRVASTLNELGKIAVQEKRLDEAEADFRRMAEIYKAVYNNKHYLIGIALSNLGGVYMERKECARAEQIYGEALRRFVNTLPPKHSNIAIAQLKLGRALLRQRRFAEAESNILKGYEVMGAPPNESSAWAQSARKDLIELYEATNRADEAQKLKVAIAVGK